MGTNMVILDNKSKLEGCDFRFLGADGAKTKRVLEYYPDIRTCPPERAGC